MPPKKGLPVGRQEDGQRPAARPAEGVQGGHVDLVDVGPLFAVDLDAHEVLVEEGRDLVVHERLALHHVAPIAARIADRKKDRLLVLLGFGQRLVAPGIPIDGVVRVQQQIGAGLFRQTIDVTLRGRLVVASARQRKEDFQQGDAKAKRQTGRDPVPWASPDYSSALAKAAHCA